MDEPGMALDWTAVLYHVVTYIVGYLTATGKAAKLLKVVRGLVGAINAADSDPIGGTAKTHAKLDPALRDSQAIKVALDVVEPKETPRVSKGARIVGVLLDLLPVIGALRRR